jgi:hypothetical protein
VTTPFDLVLVVSGGVVAVIAGALVAYLRARKPKP